MISYSDIKKGDKIILNKQPHEIIEASLMFKGRGHSTLQARIKNLITGTIMQDTFHPSDQFEEADLERIKVKFVYAAKGKYVFCYENDPSKRFELTEEQIGNASGFLKPNGVMEGLVFEGRVINIILPIKINLKVTQAPPGVKGDRAQGGNKIVTLETGAEIAVPLFIEQGDIIEINTEKEEYVRRIVK
jgi:elongation factor P